MKKLTEQDLEKLWNQTDHPESDDWEIAGYLWNGFEGEDQAVLIQFAQMIEQEVINRMKEEQ